MKTRTNNWIYPLVLIGVLFMIALSCKKKDEKSQIENSPYGWIELGGDSNALKGNGPIFCLCTDISGNVFAAGDLTNAADKHYVAKWNGTSWNELGTGSNALNANNWIGPICTDASGNVYAAGFFTNVNGYSYVAKYPH